MPAERDSVRSHVLVLLLSMVLTVTVVAGAGAVGLTALTGGVSVLVDDLRPATQSTIDLRNRMASVQGAARGWALSEDPRFVARYERAVAGVDEELDRLERLTGRDQRTVELVQAQEDSVRAYLELAADLVAEPTEAGVEGRVTRGQRQYDVFVERNDAVRERLNANVDRTARGADQQAWWVIVLVALLSLLGLAATAVLGLRVIRRLSEPLRGMEEAVARLASGDLAARAPVDGPREIREVAAALNTLAEENQYSREIEAQVVSQLRELDRAKDDFVSTVSHELRTPLTSISGYVELFEEGFVDGVTPQQSGMLAAVKRNVDRLRGLIEDLLTLSSVQADAFRTSLDVVELGALGADCVHDIGAVARESGVSLTLFATPSATSLTVRGDRAQLSRAVLNLLSNAIKFSSAGGDVRVELAQSSPREATLAVVDHGMGIPQSELSTLGTRFFRASNAVEAEIGGTGLGLRIVKTIVDNHGGRLEIDSAEGAGTTVRIVLPLVDVTAGTGNIETPPRLGTR